MFRWGRQDVPCYNVSLVRVALVWMRVQRTFHPCNTSLLSRRQKLRRWKFYASAVLVCSP